MFESNGFDDYEQIISNLSYTDLVKESRSIYQLIVELKNKIIKIIGEDKWATKRKLERQDLKNPELLELHRLANKALEQYDVLKNELEIRIMTENY